MSALTKKIEKKCCVPDCKAKITENTFFHKFPHENKRKDDWIRACNITTNVTPDMLVCGFHFTKHDYQAADRQTEGSRCLKPSAIPKKNMLSNFLELSKIDSSKKTSASPGRKKCCVPQCSAPPGEKISYHLFPKQANIREQWVRACGVRVTVHPYAAVCSAHFERSDFMTGPTSRKQVLKLEAVPTLNLPKRSVVKPEPQKILIQDKSKLITESKPDDKITTIIYVPENCSNNIISTNRTGFNNSKVVITKQESSNLDNENGFCEVQDDTTIKNTNGSRLESKLSSSQKITIIKEAMTKTSPNKKSELQRRSLNTMDVERKVISGQQENVNEVVKQRNDNNIISQLTNSVELKNTVDSSSIKRTVIRPGVSAVTLCADCGQYCKIEDEDLLYKSYKTSETLAAELLLELQEVTLSNEDEHILLTKKGIEICNKAIEKQSVNLVELLTNDDELIAFTGINFELLDKLTILVATIEGISSLKYNAPVKNRIVLCLCKLRINLSFACLGMLFAMTQQLCARNFFSMLKTLSVLLDKTIYWPKTEELMKNLPERFQSFKQTRVILNCSETQIEKQRCSNCQQKLLESNVKHQAIKLVLGVAPSGLIIFKSNIFDSQVSGVSVFTQTNIMEKLDPVREAMMADKTLDIEAECAEHNVTLIKLPKLGKKKQFSKQEVELIKNISSARIHVDRTLHRFKTYKILQDKVHWRILPYLDDVCTVIAGIVNLKNPIPPKEIDIKSVGPIRK